MNRHDCSSIFAVMAAAVVVGAIGRDAFAAPFATYDPTTGSLQP
jgi:hypothetical protein